MPQRLRGAASLRPAGPQGAAESGAPHTSCPARSPARIPVAGRRPATLQHRTFLARRLPRAHDGIDGGDPAPGEPTSLRARCPCLQGFRWRPASDPGAVARGEAQSMKRSAAPRPATAATRSPQPPPRPPPERRRAGRPTHHFLLVKQDVLTAVSIRKVYRSRMDSSE
jgi:hypothetical protein